MPDGGEKAALTRHICQQLPAADAFSILGRHHLWRKSGDFLFRGDFFAKFAPSTTSIQKQDSYENKAFPITDAGRSHDTGPGILFGA